MSRAKEETKPVSRLRLFLNAAAGQGLVLDGVDATDLYLTLYQAPPVPPEQMNRGAARIQPEHPE